MKTKTEQALARIFAHCDADWCVELNADCPTCGEHVNLLDAPDFWDGRKLEIAEHDTKESDNLEVQCPKCYHQFTVRCRW